MYWKFALVYIDLDNLKRVNDNQGHDAGDRMIKSFAVLTSSTLTHDDFIFRVGGDEFILLYTNKTIDKARQKIRDVREKCHREGISFSYGLSTARDNDKLDVDALIKDADIQMYNYKQQRKNQKNPY